MLATGTHVLIRVQSDLTLPLIGRIPPPTRTGPPTRRRCRTRPSPPPKPGRAALTIVRPATRPPSRPGPMAEAFPNGALRALATPRIVTDRPRLRDRKTKARQAFPSAG